MTSTRLQKENIMMYNVILQTCCKFSWYAEIEEYLSKQPISKGNSESDFKIDFKSFVCSEISKYGYEGGVVEYIYCNPETGISEIECPIKLNSVLDVYAGTLYFLSRI